MSFRIVFAVLLSIATALATESNCPLETLLVRTFDGTCNNLQNPTWGSSGLFFGLPEGYLAPNSVPLPNPRTVSNTVEATPDSKLDINFTAQERKFGISPDIWGRNSFFVAFGQFVAHDIGQNPLVFNFQEFLSNYKVQIEDPNDPLYQPLINGKTGILTISSQGVVENGVYRTFNNATSFLDLNTVYGPNNAVAALLRSNVGGRLKTDSTGSLLPLGSDAPVPNECGTFRPGTSAAGDLRVDENLVLASIHTLFMREHNRLADSYSNSFPTWSDEQIFQAVRTKLIATYQHIVFDEFLPTLLGPYSNRIGRYQGYDCHVDPSATASFSTAANRIIHDLVMLPQLVLTEDCQSVPIPSTSGVPLQEASNCIPIYFREVGLSSILRGSLEQRAQNSDHTVVNGLRSVFLRASTPGGNLDIETSNIFRGREHGLVSYDAMRKFHLGKSIYELPGTGCVEGALEDNLECFLQITSNASLATSLKSLYKKVNQVDAYIGMLTEDIDYPSRLPPTASKIILDQFEKLRNGDRLFYENRNIFPRAFIREIKRDSMAELLRRNNDGVEINNDAFIAHEECVLA